MKALENDENVQKRGIVHINYNVRNTHKDDGGGHNSSSSNNGTFIDPTFLELVTKLHLIQCVPFRFVSVHFCFNSPLLRQPMALIQKALTTKHRLRVRSHYGAFIILSSALYVSFIYSFCWILHFLTNPSTMNVSSLVLNLPWRLPHCM